MSGASLRIGDLSQHIKTTEDLIAFRTRYPELYNCSLTEPSVDNSDALIADMDKNGVALTLVQARPGYTTNDQVAQSVARHPDRLPGYARVGHDQEAAGYHDDPGRRASRRRGDRALPYDAQDERRRRNLHPLAHRRNPS